MKSIEDQLIDIISGKYGILQKNIKKLGRGYQNLVYEYNKNDVSYILRISKSSTRSNIEIHSELAFLKHLSQFGVSVSLAIKSTDGEIVEKIIIGDLEYFAVIFKKASGNHITYPDYLNNHDLFYELGKITGKLHKTSETFSKTLNNRIDWKDNYYLKNFNKFIIEDCQKTLSMEKQIQQISKLQMNDNNYGLIHGDINVGNFFVNKNQITLFDFDECQNSWFLEDIAIQLFYTVYVINDDSIQERHEKAIDFMQHFLKGYKTERSLDTEMLKLIPQFLILREMIVHVGIYKMWDLDNLTGWALDYYRDSSKRIIDRTSIVEFDSEWLKTI